MTKLEVCDLFDTVLQGLASSEMSGAAGSAAVLVKAKARWGILASAIRKRAAE
jgi:hypothetical protein